jgi:hypothetical protein
MFLGKPLPSSQNSILYASRQANISKQSSPLMTKTNSVLDAILWFFVLAPDSTLAQTKIFIGDKSRLTDNTTESLAL